MDVIALSEEEITNAAKKLAIFTFKDKD